MSSLWVMAKSGAARYFESVVFRSPPFIASAFFGRSWRVPLHTLLLITITKRMYLVNGYSVVKELREAHRKAPHFSKGKNEGAMHGKFNFPKVFELCRIFMMCLLALDWLIHRYGFNSTAILPVIEMLLYELPFFSDSSVREDFSCPNIHSADNGFRNNLRFISNKLKAVPLSSALFNRF